MAEHLPPVEPVGPMLGQRPQTLELQQLTARAQVEEVQSATFSRMAERALTSAVERPNAVSPMSAAHADLTDPASGTVGIEKDGLVSDVSRSGMAGRDEGADSDVLATQQEDRIKTLYLDLTNYQIAWKIAQRLQQDITQLMKGS